MNLDEFASLLSTLEEKHYSIKFPEHGGAAIRLLSIVEELGEVARIINKRAIGRRSEETTHAHLEEELGDLLLNLLAAVKSYGVNPMDAIRKAADKWGKIMGAEVLVPDAY